MPLKLPLRFPTTILLIGAAYGALAAVMAGIDSAGSSGGIFSDEVQVVLGVIVWGLSVLFWHGVALVSWRYQPMRLAAVALPSLGIALLIGALNGSLVQMTWTQIGLIGSAVVTGALSKQARPPAVAWMIGAAVSVAATLAWMSMDYPKIEQSVTPERAVASDSTAAVASVTTTGVKPSPEHAVPSDSGTAADGSDSAERSDAVVTIESIMRRLLPGELIVSELTPVAIGGALFLRSSNALQGGPGLLPSLRVPFGLMPVLTVALVTRLLLDEPAARWADNLLFVLALVYLMGGIAMVSFVMRFYQLPLLFRVGAWLLTLLFVPVSFPLLIVGGLTDSFLDFRGRLTAPPPLSEDR